MRTRFRSRSRNADQASCPHVPCCPTADSVDREAAHTLVSHPEQGWSLLCNGVILFDDTGELLPDGRAIAPHRGPIPILIPIPRQGGRR